MGYEAGGRGGRRPRRLAAARTKVPLGWPAELSRRQWTNSPSSLSRRSAGRVDEPHIDLFLTTLDPGERRPACGQLRRHSQQAGDDTRAGLRRWPIFDRCGARPGSRNRILRWGHDRKHAILQRARTVESCSLSMRAPRRCGTLTRHHDYHGGVQPTGRAPVDVHHPVIATFPALEGCLRFFLGRALGCRIAPPTCCTAAPARITARPRNSSKKTHCRPPCPGNIHAGTSGTPRSRLFSRVGIFTRRSSSPRYAASTPFSWRARRRLGPPSATSFRRLRATIVGEVFDDRLPRVGPLSTPFCAP